MYTVRVIGVVAPQPLLYKSSKVREVNFTVHRLKVGPITIIVKPETVTAQPVVSYGCEVFEVDVEITVDVRGQAVACGQDPAAVCENRRGGSRQVDSGD